MINYYLGMSYQSIGRHEEAIKNFEEAYKESQDDRVRGDIKYQVGYSRLGLGDKKGAKEALIEAVKYKPDCGESYNLLGMMYKEEGDNKKAIEVLKEGIKQSPDNWENYNLLGVVYREQGLLEESVKMLKKAIEIKPEEWRNYNILGNIYNKNNDYEEAKRMYERALTLCPDDGYKSKINDSLEKVQRNKTG